MRFSLKIGIRLNVQPIIGRGVRGLSSSRVVARIERPLFPHYADDICSVYESTSTIRML